VAQSVGQVNVQYVRNIYKYYVASKMVVNKGNLADSGVGQEGKFFRRRTE
jgi:hypothetical protein